MQHLRPHLDIPPPRCSRRRSLSRSALPLRPWCAESGLQVWQDTQEPFSSGEGAPQCSCPLGGGTAAGRSAVQSHQVHPQCGACPAGGAGGHKAGAESSSHSAAGSSSAAGANAARHACRGRCHRQRQRRRRMGAALPMQEGSGPRGLNYSEAACGCICLERCLGRRRPCGRGSHAGTWQDRQAAGSSDSGLPWGAPMLHVKPSYLTAAGCGQESDAGPAREPACAARRLASGREQRRR